MLDYELKTRDEKNTRKMLFIYLTKFKVIILTMPVNCYAYELHQVYTLNALLTSTTLLYLFEGIAQFGEHASNKVLHQ